MDRLQAMRVFTRIVELRSFTKVADDLQLQRASVTNIIKELEAYLGVRLLQRTTRHVSVTEDGDAYYQRCVRLLADLEETEAAFNITKFKPKGKLRVDLQGSLAQHFVLPHIGEFFERYPDLELEIGMGDRLVDLVREGVDCVLRAGELRDQSMVARRVALLEQITCASADYLARRGVPKTLEALSEHQAVNFLSTATGKPVPFEFKVGSETRSVRLKGQVTVAQAEAYVACCLAGMGLVQLPRYHVEQHLAERRLKEVLAAYRPAPMPVSVLYAHQRQLSPRVRVFVDWVVGLMERGR